jgi:hypothetical protein
VASGVLALYLGMVLDLLAAGHGMDCRSTTAPAAS